MKQFDLEVFLQSLAEQGFDPKLGLIIAIGVFLLLVVVYLLRKRTARSDAQPKTAATKKPGQSIPREPVLDRRSIVEKDIPLDSPKSSAVETPRPTIQQEPTRKQPPIVAGKTPAQPPAVAVPTGLPHIPQESVLRRHYLTHIRHMIETTLFPRPTESVLRRHYEQLVGSIQEACVNDAAELDKLIRRYDAHRKSIIN